MFDWAEYLALAQELVGQQVPPAGQEAHQRAAISRAYYAAFCKARNRLRDKEGHQDIPKSARAHRYVSDPFRNSSDQARNEIGAHLDRLRLDRNKADYDDSVAGIHGMAATDLILAAQVLATLDIL